MREIKFRVWDVSDERMYYGITNLADINGYVMQYTGIKDVHGRDIYEGDIVNCFRHEGFEFVTTRLGAHGIETQLGFYPFTEVYGYAEVLGNIYENPELLDNASN